MSIAVLITIVFPVWKPRFLGCPPKLTERWPTGSLAHWTREQKVCLFCEWAVLRLQVHGKCCDNFSTMCGVVLFCEPRKTVWWDKRILLHMGAQHLDIRDCLQPHNIKHSCWFDSIHLSSQYFYEIDVVFPLHYSEVSLKSLPNCRRQIFRATLLHRSTICIVIYAAVVDPRF